MSDVAPTLDSVLTAQRAAFLNNLNNSAQAAQQNANAQAITQISEDAQNLRSINTSLTTPLDPNRGRTVNIAV